MCEAAGAGAGGGSRDVPGVGGGAHLYRVPREVLEDDARKEHAEEGWELQLRHSEGGLVSVEQGEAETA